MSLRYRPFTEVVLVVRQNFKPFKGIVINDQLVVEELLMDILCLFSALLGRLNPELDFSLPEETAIELHFDLPFAAHPSADGAFIREGPREAVLSRGRKEAEAALDRPLRSALLRPLRLAGVFKVFAELELALLPVVRPGVAFLVCIPCPENLLGLVKLVVVLSVKWDRAHRCFDLTQLAQIIEVCG